MGKRKVHLNYFVCHYDGYARSHFGRFYRTRELFFYDLAHAIYIIVIT